MGSEISDNRKSTGEQSLSSAHSQSETNWLSELHAVRVAQAQIKPEAPRQSDEPSSSWTKIETAGIAVAGTALLVAGLKYKPLRSLAEDVFKLGGEGNAERMAKLIPKYPALGMDSLVTKITENLNQGCLTRDVFDKLVGSVPEADRGLAKEIAKRSLPNASDFTLMHSLRDMGKQLEGKGIDLGGIYELASAHAASPGQTTGYLFRKANGFKAGVHNVGALDTSLNDFSGVQALRAAETSKPIFLFDHIADLQPAQVEHLKKAKEAGSQVFVMDANNFHGGINFTDLANGTAEQKLQSLVDQAKKLSLETPGASDEQLAYRVLNEKTDRDAAAIGATIVRPSPVSDETLFRQLVSKDKVEDYLEKFQNPINKRFAAETLADIDYDSFVGIAKKTRKLGAAIEEDARRSSIDPSKEVKFLVGVDNWPNMGASSGGFVSSVYREMNGIEPQKFVDFEGMYYGRGPSPKRVYVLDDMSHSGEQIEEVARDLRRERGVGGLSFSTLSSLSTSRAMRYNVDTAKSPGVLRFIAAEVKDPIAESSRAAIKALKAESGFFSRSSDALLQAKARRDVYLQMTGDVKGLSARNANQLNPYGVSDRTNPITSDFASEILNMHQWGYSQ